MYPNDTSEKGIWQLYSKDTEKMHCSQCLQQLVSMKMVKNRYLTQKTRFLSEGEKNGTAFANKLYVIREPFNQSIDDIGSALSAQS
jgi:hypothetical protein